MQKATIGVDVSKDHLDAYRLIDDANQRFSRLHGRVFDGE